MQTQKFDSKISQGLYWDRIRWDEYNSPSSSKQHLETYVQR